MDFKGEFNTKGNYKPGDVVLLNKVPYMKIGTGANTSPTDTTQWVKLAGGGAGAGIPGRRGQDGKGVPAGGDAGQVLTKTGAANFATAWQDPTSGGDGLTQAQVLARQSVGV